MIYSLTSTLFLSRPTITLFYSTVFNQQICQRGEKGKTSIFSRVLATLLAALFAGAVNSTRVGKKSTNYRRSKNTGRSRPLLATRFTRSNRVPALSATENSVQTQFRSFLYSDSRNAPLESASEAAPIYRLTVTRPRGWFCVVRHFFFFFMHAPRAKRRRKDSNAIRLKSPQRDRSRNTAAEEVVSDCSYHHFRI